MSSHEDACLFADILWRERLERAEAHSSEPPPASSAATPRLGQRTAVMDGYAFHKRLLFGRQPLDLLWVKRHCVHGHAK
jgi:hypothetical protein